MGEGKGREVVELLAPGSVGVDDLGRGVDHGLGRGEGRAGGEALGEGRVAEEGLVLVDRLGHAVGEDEEGLAGREGHGLVDELDVVEEAEQGAVLLLERAGRLADDEWRGVAGVGEGDGARRGVDDAGEDRDEHALGVGLADVVVDLGEHRSGAVADGEAFLDHGLDHHHEEGDGHALARGVAHGHGDAVAVQADDVGSMNRRGQTALEVLLQQRYTSVKQK